MSHKYFKLHISRLIVLLLCVMLVMTAVPSAFAAEGTCGDDLTWYFDGSTLTITGTGVMDDYSEDDPAPWHEVRTQILWLSLPDGLSRIGTYAFAGCSNLASVNIPSSVEIIDRNAFMDCTKMTVLMLSEGIRTIGQCAFERCVSLADLRLPNTLLNLEHHAFYMCESLTYVTIPGYLRTIGSGVFAYCSSLLRVDVNAAVTMPSWSFYGCDKLQIVTIRGESVDPESLKISTPPQGIDKEENPEQPTEESQPAEPEETTPAPDTGYVTGESITTDSDGAQIVDKTTVMQNENSTTVSTTTAPVDQPENTTTTITSTIQNNQGWQDVLDKVNSATIGGNSNTVNVTVYVPNNDTVPSEVLDELAGKNVQLTVQTQTGSQFTLDCTQLNDSVKNDLSLNYTLVPIEDVPEELKGYTVYQLKFLSKVKLNTELVIRLPGGHILSTATLYQLKGRNKLEKLQSVIVDPNGDAHWYVSAVDEKTEYLIGIDVPGSAEDSPIIPPALHNEYKVENVYDGVEYVITGRTSSWGMNLGQVMGIMAAVMVSVIVIVGVVIFTINKRRIRKGYVPGWDDLDDEE